MSTIFDTCNQYAQISLQKLAVAVSSAVTGMQEPFRTDSVTQLVSLGHFSLVLTVNTTNQLLLFPLLLF